MHIQIETECDADKRIIDSLATTLLSIATGKITRAEVADQVRHFGYEPYIGGRHVAVHRMDAVGKLSPGRLALITHDSPDFS